MEKGAGLLPKSRMKFREKEVEFKKHRKNPFDAKYMHMATSSFSAGCRGGCHCLDNKDISFDCDKEVSVPFDNVVQRLWPEGFSACPSEDHQHLCSQLTAFKQFIGPIKKKLALADTESESEDERDADDARSEDGSRASTQEFGTYKSDPYCLTRLPLASNRNSTTAPVESTCMASSPVHFGKENPESQDNPSHSLTCAEITKAKNKSMTIDGSYTSLGTLKTGVDDTWINDEAESIEQFSDGGSSAFTTIDHLDRADFSDARLLDLKLYKAKGNSAFVASKMYEAADHFLNARMKQVGRTKNKPRVELKMEDLLIPYLKDARQEDIAKVENIDFHAPENKAMFRSSLCRESLDLVDYRRLLLKAPLKIARSLNFVALFHCMGDKELNCEDTFETARDLLNQSGKTDLFGSYASSSQVPKPTPNLVTTSVISASLPCSTRAIDVQGNVDMGEDSSKDFECSKKNGALSGEAKVENSGSQCHPENYESYESMISELSLQKEETRNHLKLEVAQSIATVKVCKLQDFISDVLQRELQVQEQGAYVHKVAPIIREALVTEATRLHQLGGKVHLTFGWLLNWCLKGNHTNLEIYKDSNQEIPLRHYLLDMINFAHQHNIGSHKLIKGEFLNAYSIKLECVSASHLQDMTITFIEVEEP